MAIKDTSRKPYIEDNDVNIKIGIDLPIRRGDVKDGYFASTSTTIEAVKNNIRNLLQTHEGERFMQPNLGIDLKKHLFNPVGIETQTVFKEDLEKQLQIWFPFLFIKNIDIHRRDDEHIVKFKITFSYKKTPTMSESVQIEVDVGSSY